MSKKVTDTFEPHQMALYLNIIAFAYTMQDGGWSKRGFEKNDECFETLTVWQEDFERALMELFQYTTEAKYVNLPDTEWMQPFSLVIAQMYHFMPKLLKWGEKEAKLSEFKRKRAKSK